jgi:CheY-like chemotaxis protein
MNNECYRKKIIKNVMIVDDMPDARESMIDIVEDANFIALPENGIITSLESCIEKVQRTADAAIFDYHLSKRPYATFNGVEVIKRLYRITPILLASSFLQADSFEIQVDRQYIPVVIESNKINEDTIIRGFEYCQNEFMGNFSSVRRPWRSLIRVEEISSDAKSVYIVIPSWDSKEKIRLPISIFPVRDKQILGMRFFAQVNIGAENYTDLYCYDIKTAEKPKGRYAEFLHS